MQRDTLVDIPGYKLERILGEGGMATVHLAIQDALDRHVAIKILKNFDKPEQSRRFLNEGRYIASLAHQNIITIYDICVIGDQHYISMEYLEGGDLESRIQEGIGPEAAINLLKVIGNCLIFVHSKGIIHRDIKPANILFRNDNTPVLTDFGIAKHLDHNTGLTSDGTAIGSPDYLSPEQAECKSLDGRSDIYSLGIVLYEMLTGRTPYHSDSYIETLMGHITKPVPQLPPALERYQELLERMLAKDAQDRFGSAAEMVAYLDRIESTTPMKAVSAKAMGIMRRLRNPSPVVTTSKMTQVITKDEVAAGPSIITQPGSRYGFQALVNRLANGPSTIVRRGLQVSAILVLVISSLWVSSRTQDEQSLNSSESEVERYLLKARAAMKMDKLTMPEEDNAFLYYQEIIKLEPDNEEAQNGLAKIANHYADLAEQALDRFEYVNARHYVNQGIRVQPENSRLAALHHRTYAINDVPARIFKGVKSIFE